MYIHLIAELLALAIFLAYSYHGTVLFQSLKYKNNLTYKDLIKAEVDLLKKDISYGRAVILIPTVVLVTVYAIALFALPISKYHWIFSLFVIFITVKSFYHYNTVLLLSEGDFEKNLQKNLYTLIRKKHKTLSKENSKNYIKKHYQISSDLNQYVETLSEENIYTNKEGCFFSIKQKGDKTIIEELNLLPTPMAKRFYESLNISTELNLVLLEAFVLSLALFLTINPIWS